MGKSFLLGSCFLFLMAIIPNYSFISPETPTKDVNWMTWEEAVALNEKNPKKIFIDVYTDWCGWCKRLEKSTFQHPEVADYLNKNFHPVKLDAEMTRDVKFKDHTFKYIPSGRRGVHELAAALLDNRMSYPSCVAMDEDINRITIIPGYREYEDMLDILTYINLEKYKEMTFKEFIDKKK